ncbi:hypothetical protein CcaverHIS002_0101630 [Cutaneotrichosporon cavernicola]|uniref:Uncharacterized protein n=1 Tax=Cutaneotrichosporon cavernicola TaxID=279322 RepID=A0AA48L0E3_9TREE|nr:uncharacterized protein CcaverHIS019_0101600 [Cutaneotrichosporon cavernicola]BEI79634.1 hypothetical protein CcaverHIS002_0101630 [Cutaneotrichosporon cavernicola]BEI87442.1 hypothetical protein CcaverHIS019_0101600 [Cutaneotrichosporon cavernicola]BEI95211.1 hypothetical protein CcaverHIS631_0101600 [Cutaneotrichosporon cavernicola]BEJ02984.1 hypothetical protein CcaverHIS641_0101590 [Cutaneotrichosporon cavernicola]
MSHSHYFNTSIHTPYPSKFDSVEDSWAPLVPGLLDLDPCADSPIKMNFDFEPLHYEVKLGHSHGPSHGHKARSTPRSERTVSKSDVGLNMFGEIHGETQHIEDMDQASLSSSASAPRQQLSTPSLLRAPRLPTRPLMSSPNSPLIAADPSMTSSSIIPSVEGTRAPAAPRFSALGLDLTAGPELMYPSPPISPTAGRGRRRARPSITERSQDVERGRTRERGRRTEDDDVPDLAHSHDELSLRNRVNDWSSAVYAATSSPSTPPESSPIALALYDEVELATALGRLNADSVGPVRVPSASVEVLARPGLHRATSLQHDTAPGAAQLGPWALRVGQSRSRLVNVPRLRRAATSSSAHRI